MQRSKLTLRRFWRFSARCLRTVRGLAAIPKGHACRRWHFYARCLTLVREVVAAPKFTLCKLLHFSARCLTASFVPFLHKEGGAPARQALAPLREVLDCLVRELAAAREVPACRLWPLSARCLLACP